MKGQNFHEHYRVLLARLFNFGARVNPRGQPTLELQDVTVVLPPETDGGACAGRTNPAYLLAETQWYASRDPSVAFIQQHASLWSKIQNPDGTANSNYGEKIWSPLQNRSGVASEWWWAKQSLLKDPATRQAVMVIHRPEHHWDGNKDVPCTLTASFTARDGMLQMRVHMRSSDAWFGLPYDVPFFLWLHRRMVYELAAAGLQLRPGTFRLQLDSLHLYQHREPHAAAYLRDWRPAPSWVNPVPVDLSLEATECLCEELLAARAAPGVTS